MKQWHMHFCNGEKGLKVVVERVWRLGCWCHFFFYSFFSSADTDRKTESVATSVCLVQRETSSKYCGKCKEWFRLRGVHL